MPGRRAREWSSRNSVTVSGTARSFPRDREPKRIQGKAPAYDRRLIAAARPLGRRGPPQKHFHPRHQLAHRERLAQVVVRADLQPEHAVELFFARRHEDDRKRLRARRGGAGTDPGRRAGEARCRARPDRAAPAPSPPTRSGRRRTARPRWPSRRSARQIPSRMVSSSSTTTIRRVGAFIRIHPGGAGPARSFTVAHAAKRPRAFLSPQFAFEFDAAGHPADTRSVPNCLCAQRDVLLASAYESRRARARRRSGGGIRAPRATA